MVRLVKALAIAATLASCSGGESSAGGHGGDAGGTAAGTASARGGASAAGGAQASDGGTVNASGGANAASGGSSGGRAAEAGGRTGVGGNIAAAGAGTGGKSGAGGSGSSNGGRAGGGSGGSSSGGAPVSALGGASSVSGGASQWNAGNPAASCKSTLPARAEPVDTSTPTTLVGTGTAASCTFAKLAAAVAQGGIIAFDCGANPISIAVTSTLKPPTNKNTVIDGGRKVTLDGGKSVQLINFTSPDFRANDHGLTLQHIALVNGKQTPIEAIPKADPPCSQGFNDGEGGAVFVRDGYLTVIDSIFTGNQAAPLGPDTGGGAIYVLGSKAGVVIAGSTFTKNAASNAGAVGALFAELQIYNSWFSDNTALGHDANNDDASQCDAINNGQHEIGSGGNGGAIYSDGNSVNVTLCGDVIMDNAAGTKAFGGGLFFTSNDLGGTLSISDTTMTGNSGGHWTNVAMGSTKNAGTAVGTNCKSLSIVNSTLQGL